MRSVRFIGQVSIKEWNLSNPDTLGTISGVLFMEVSWFQGLVNMQMQHLGPQ